MTDTDRKIADAFDDAIEELNRRATDAHDAGLRVDLHLRKIPGTSIKVVEGEVYRRVIPRRETIGEDRPRATRRGRPSQRKE